MSISRFSVLVFSLMTVAAACGSDGDPGAPGPKGDMGQMGDSGAPGEDGTSGTNGISCWDLNSNRTCDVATEDKNADAACTPADCQGAVGPQGPAGSGTAGQLATTVFGTAGATIPNTQTTPVLLQGLTQTVTVPATGSYVALISTHGGLFADIFTEDDYGMVDVITFVDNTGVIPGGFQRLIANAYDLQHWSFSVTRPLAAGTHTISVGVRGNLDSTVDTIVGGANNTALQGTLNVVLIRL
jgi:hypothetical protein